MTGLVTVAVTDPPDSLIATHSRSKWWGSAAGARWNGGPRSTVVRCLQKGPQLINEYAFCGFLCDVGIRMSVVAPRRIADTTKVPTRSTGRPRRTIKKQRHVPPGARRRAKWRASLEGPPPRPPLGSPRELAGQPPVYGRQRHDGRDDGLVYHPPRRRVLLKRDCLQRHLRCWRPPHRQHLMLARAPAEGDAPGLPSASSRVWVQSQPI